VTEPNKRIVACFDKFRLTATAPQLCRAVAEESWEHYWDCVQLPMADGGEGTIEVLHTHGGSLYEADVVGPLGARVTAAWLLRGRTAFIEMAQASGLALVGGPEGNRPLDASTYGTGELINAALNNGAKRIVVTVGGSATTDGGLGALDAMAPLARFRGIELVVACDVDTKFVNAAADFGPQKGATPAQVALLRRRLEQLADRYQADRNVNIRDLPGGGAAGGLAGALASLGARITSGFGLVADEARLAEAIADADVVITGEGRLDQESFNGKVVGGVCELAATAGKPVVIVCGAMEDGLVIPTDVRNSVAEIVVLTDRFGAERSWSEPVSCVRELVPELLASR
jgi:glycerate 2-kinase